VCLSRVVVAAGVLLAGTVGEEMIEEGETVGAVMTVGVMTVGVMTVVVMTVVVIVVDVVVMIAEEVVSVVEKRAGSAVVEMGVVTVAIVHRLHLKNVRS
jgi:hypothetical protein